MTWAETARAQCGVITRRQLIAAGLTTERVDGLRQSGAIDVLTRGTYLVRGAPCSYDAQLWAAVLAFDGVLGFASGAHLWGMDDKPDTINVIVARNRHLWRVPGVRTHRIDLPPWAIACRAGLPVTSRRETALDHVGRLRGSAAGVFADRALQREWLHPRDFEDRVRRQPGRIGNTRLRLLATTAGDGAAAHSERVLHRILRSAGLVGWVPNHDVWNRGELVAVVDVAFVLARVAVEIDGLAFHTAADRFQRDRTRQNDLVGLGWVVLRFTWADLIERPRYVAATIRRHVTNSGSLTG